MFLHKETVIFNSEFNIPESGNVISGSCTVLTSIGIPDNFESSKVIFCKVNVNASITGVDSPLFKVISISEFSVEKDDSPEDVIQEKADKECAPIAIQKTFERIADVTELLCGQRIDLSSNN